MAVPIRRRVAAVLTSLALCVGIFGYMQRSASEAASEAPRVPACTPAEAMEKGSTLGCLNLLDGRSSR